VPLDNNVSERALRVCALGRKNFLFVGTDHAGENLKVKLLRVPNVRRVVLDEEAFQRLRAAAEEWLRPILLVAFDTGMRKSKVLNLCGHSSISRSALSGSRPRTRRPRSLGSST